GGDGTILLAERMFPGIPKLAVKHANICHRCELGKDELDMSLEKIKQGKFFITEQIKLEASAKGKKLVGLNEIQVHTRTPIQAIRFSVNAGNKHFENLIGDGIIVATPFGSTAYYRSTGGKLFKKGIGISFNNLHPKHVKSFTIPENSPVEIRVNREPAYLIADNNEKFIPLNPGDKVIVKKSKHAARFIQL
ncbi:NAD(+)/NADH kinase, partial [archaeon]